MICNNCGKEVADNAKFCDGCGSPILPGQLDEVNASVQATPPIMKLWRKK